MSGKTKILIVDDHTVVIKGIRSALAEHHDLEVTEKLGADSLSELTEIAIKKKLIEP